MRTLFSSYVFGDLAKEIESPVRALAALNKKLVARHGRAAALQREGARARKKALRRSRSFHHWLFQSLF